MFHSKGNKMCFISCKYSQSSRNTFNKDPLWKSIVWPSRLTTIWKKWNYLIKAYGDSATGKHKIRGKSRSEGGLQSVKHYCNFAQKLVRCYISRKVRVEKMKWSDVKCSNILRISWHLLWNWHSKHGHKNSKLDF